MTQKLEKACLFIIKWGNYLILFLPILVYQQVLYPYIFGKVVFFHIIVEIIFTVWLLLIIYRKNYRPNWRHPLVLTNTIFLAALFLTAIFGVDFYRSFWSNQERMTGLLTMIHLWLWFIILGGVFKKWSDWTKFIGVSLICSVLVGLYGLGQKIGLRSLLPSTNPNQINSTLGNSIFLGAYAMLNVFLGAVLFLKSKQRWIKILTTLVMVLNVVVMLLTLERGVILSFIIAALILIVFIVIKRLSPKVKSLGIIILILLFAGIIGVYIYFQSPAIKSIEDKLPSYLPRFFDFKTLTSDLSHRTIPWQIAWQGFKERPILGWGWENYNIVFNKYYQPKILEWGLGNTWFDQPHNQLMDLLATSGMLGALAYLFFYGTVLYLLIKKIKKTEIFAEKLPFLMLILMFIAYFIQNLTVFDSPVPLIIFYFILGLVYFLNQNGHECVDTDHQSIKDGQSKVPLPLAIFVLLILASIIIYQFNLIPLQRSKLGLMASSALDLAASSVKYKNLLNNGLDLFQKSLTPETFVAPEVRLLLSVSLMSIDPTGAGINGNDFNKAINMGIAELQKNTIEHPRDARYWLYLAQLYNLEANYDPSYSQLAERAIATGLTLSPKRQQFYFELSRTKINEGRYQEAVDSSKTALGFDENASMSHYNLAIVYLENRPLQNSTSPEQWQNNPASTENLALQELETATRISVSNADQEFLLTIADAYANLNQYNQGITNQYDQALKIINQIIDHPSFHEQPQQIKANAYTQKIIYLIKLNNIDGAKNTLNELETVDPRTAQQLRANLSI